MASATRPSPGKSRTVAVLNSNMIHTWLRAEYQRARRHCRAQVTRVAFRDLRARSIAYDTGRRHGKRRRGSRCRHTPDFRTRSSSVINWMRRWKRRGTPNDILGAGPRLFNSSLGCGVAQAKHASHGVSSGLRASLYRRPAKSWLNSLGSDVKSFAVGCILQVSSTWALGGRYGIAIIVPANDTMRWLGKAVALALKEATKRAPAEGSRSSRSGRGLPRIRSSP